MLSYANWWTRFTFGELNRAFLLLSNFKLGLHARLLYCGLFRYIDRIKNSK